MDIQDLRKQIDQIDAGLVELYKQRMETAGRIGAYKRENNLPVYDSERERSLLNRVGALAGEEYENGVRAMFSMLMEQSRTRQQVMMHRESQLTREILRAVADTEPLFPPKATVACQGVEGAYSQTACEKIFRAPDILYCETFDSVFSAIESGLCRYGVLPIENSLAGSVNSVYDQLIRRHFYIVRSARIKDSRTRFICISKRLEIYPGADRTSLMLVLPNRPGSLWQMLSRFCAQGINLTKLESRPIPGRDFEFMFCFDIDASVDSPSFARLIEELDATLENFTYLGSYSEIV